jgi:hypothetical protein
VCRRRRRCSARRPSGARRLAGAVERHPPRGRPRAALLPPRVRTRGCRGRLWPRAEARGDGCEPKTKSKKMGAAGLLGWGARGVREERRMLRSREGREARPGGEGAKPPLRAQIFYSRAACAQQGEPDGADHACWKGIRAPSQMGSKHSPLPPPPLPPPPPPPRCCVPPVSACAPPKLPVESIVVEWGAAGMGRRSAQAAATALRRWPNTRRPAAARWARRRAGAQPPKARDSNNLCLPRSMARRRPQPTGAQHGSSSASAARAPAARSPGLAPRALPPPAPHPPPAPEAASCSASIARVRRAARNDLSRGQRERESQARAAAANPAERRPLPHTRLPPAAPRRP